MRRIPTRDLLRRLTPGTPLFVDDSVADELRPRLWCVVVHGGATLGNVKILSRGWEGGGLQEDTWWLPPWGLDDVRARRITFWELEEGDDHYTELLVMQAKYALLGEVTPDAA